jgi:hypothetical protein
MAAAPASPCVKIGVADPGSAPRLDRGGAVDAEARR